MILKNSISIILFSFYSVCVAQQSKSNNTKITTEKSKESKTVASNKSKNNSSQPSATYFFLIADTSKDYFMLDKKMFDIHTKLSLAIDTMGRYYNKEKDLIALPDNSEDELYAGNYFPRRSCSSDLSLEYLYYSYDKGGVSKKTIALVAGIFESKKEGEEALKLIKPMYPKTYLTKKSVYLGCMH